MRRPALAAALIAFALAVSMTAPALGTPAATPSHEAPPQEERTLNLTANGTAEERDGDEIHDLDLTVDGNATVTETEEGHDRTADSPWGNITVNATVDGTSYEMTGALGGQGSPDFRPVGVEVWNLTITGATVADGQDAGQDTQDGSDSSSAQFFGNVTMVGADGEFQVAGSGTLVVTDADGRTNYDLDYDGEATFE